MLFFGSAYQVLARVKAMIENDRPQTIVLDFTRVVACDSSAVAVIARMCKLLAREKVAFAVAGAQARFVQMLRTGGCLPADSMVYADRNEALEAGETMVLLQEGALQQATTIRTWLAAVLDSDRFAAILMATLVLPRSRARLVYLSHRRSLRSAVLYRERPHRGSRRFAGHGEPRAHPRRPHPSRGSTLLCSVYRVRPACGPSRRRALWVLERVVFDRLPRRASPIWQSPCCATSFAINPNAWGFATRQNAVLA